MILRELIEKARRSIPTVGELRDPEDDLTQITDCFDGAILLAGQIVGKLLALQERYADYCGWPVDVEIRKGWMLLFHAVHKEAAILQVEKFPERTTLIARFRELEKLLQGAYGENLRLAAVTPEDDRRIRDYIDAHAKRLPRSGALAMLVDQTK